MVNKFKYLDYAVENILRIREVLMKWKITDKRFNMACVYLIHFNKFKIIEDTTEKILYQLIEPVDINTLYKESRCVVVDKFYRLVDCSIKSMFKGKSLSIFEMVSIEILNKLNIYFYTTLFETVNNKIDDMTVGDVVKWVNGFDCFVDRVDRHYKKFAKGLDINIALLEKCSNKEYVIKTTTKLQNKLFDFLLKKVDIVFNRYTNKTDLESFSFKSVLIDIDGFLFSGIELEEKSALVFERLKLDKLITQIIFHSLNNGGGNRITHLTNILNQIKTYIVNCCYKESLEDQSLFIEKFCIFLSSESFFKCENALCCITNLLSVKLNRKDLTLIIKERGFKKSKVEEELFKSIFNHFKKQQKMEKARTSKQAIYKRLSTFLNCTLFVIKLKRCLKRKVKRRELRKSIFFNKSRTMPNRILDYTLLEEVKEIKVGMCILDPTTYTEQYSGNYVTALVKKLKKHKTPKRPYNNTRRRDFFLL